MDRVHSALGKFGRDLQKYPVLVEMEKRLKCPKQYLVIGVASVLLICLFADFGAGLICNIGGYIYPAYRSFKAIESGSSKDDTQLLMYWIIFAAFSILEAFLAFLLHSIPFYFVLKIAFLVWCFLPQTEGAQVVYNNVIKDFLASTNLEGTRSAGIPEGSKHIKGS